MSVQVWLFWQWTSLYSWMFKCDFNAKCVGDTSCVCKAGYTGSGEVCTDIDECAVGTSTCDSNAVCSNTAGGYTCACKDEYTENGQSCSASSSETSSINNLVMLNAMLLCFWRM
ncbi:uromodulin isoform X3 [Nematostella vectensis]|uniref:uromodulin isoform X3 n=1 Tax=Nematostella vectensis TaxID=45351 RepID=UPI002077023A|nr:uromodulin isoform X3 [Nematostella vectensis]